MNGLRKFFKFVYNAVITFLVVIGILFVVSFLVGIQPFVVESGSMEPKIHVGSVCFVNTRIKYEQIKTNDIIAYNTPGGVRVTHRVVEINDKGLETKGDANENKDGIPVTQNEYMGKTIFSIPKAGYIVKFIQNPIGLAVSALAVVILILIEMLINSTGKEEKVQDKNEGKKQEEEIKNNNKK